MLELTQTQLNTLVSILNEDKETIHKYYDKLRSKYPNGTMTLAEFIEANNDKPEENEPRVKEMLKFLFDAIDYDHSGTIDIYEHLLAMGLFGNPLNDPDVAMKCLFQLCDSNHDGRLTKEEIAKIVNILIIKLQMIDETKTTNPQAYMEHVMSIINKSFGAKTQISEEEFRQILNENEDLQEIAKTAQGALVTGLFILSRPPDYESD